ncbi:MAG: PHP domain-containing protein, partial [Spirochaetales bacterium]
MSTFVHLHNRSDYSLLRSLTSVESLVDRAARLGMPAVALTDENVLSGALHFYNRCAGTLSASGEPIKPIIGCDLGMDTSWLGSRQPAADRDCGGRIVLIALNSDGIAQLIQLSSQTCRNGRDRPIPLTRTVLEKHADNLLLLTGGINGVLSGCLGSGMPAAAHTFLEWAKTVYGTDDVFVELVRDGNSRRDLAGDGLAELARTHALNTVATNDTFYPMTEDARAHEVLECVRESKSYEDPDHPRLPSDELSIKSAEQMIELFSDVPEAVENTVRIAAMIDPDWKLPGPIFPRPELPEAYSDSRDYLRDSVLAGLQERYGDVGPEVRERAEMELQYIIST